MLPPRLPTGWFVLRIAPKREALVAELLEARGFQVMLPHEIKWRKPRGRRARKVSRWEPYQHPVFTRLLFARIDGMSHWVRLASLPFVQGVLSQNGKQYALPEDDVWLIRYMVNNPIGAGDKRSEYNPHVAVGKPAKILEGPFRGFTGEIEAIVGRKAQLMVRLFGTLQAVRLPLVSLEAA